MHKYLVIIERTPSGYSAFSPDLPGCVATGESRAEVEQNLREAIAFHLKGLQIEGEPIPLPSAESAYLEVRT